MVMSMNRWTSEVLGYRFIYSSQTGVNLINNSQVLNYTVYFALQIVSCTDMYVHSSNA